MREVNLYKEGDHVPYGQKLENIKLTECWSQLMLQSNFDRRRVEVNEFNKWVYMHVFCAVHSQWTTAEIRRIRSNNGPIVIILVTSGLATVVASFVAWTKLLYVEPG